MAKLPLSPEEIALPYSRYYDLPFPEVTDEDRGFLESPMAADQVMPIADAAEYLALAGKDSFAPNGYRLLEYGAYTSCTVFLPDCTPEMIDWWFVWLNHPDPSVPAEYGNLKYKIWCPPDHWDHHFLDEDDPDAGMRICESLDLGQGAPRKNIINKSLPIELLGIDPSVIEGVKKRGISLKFGAGCDENGVPGGVGINMFIPAEGGAVWTSRGWGGITPRNGRLEVTGNGSPDEKDVQCELTHNVLERRHLGEILPGLYREYGGQ